MTIDTDLLRTLGWSDELIESVVSGARRFSAPADGTSIRVGVETSITSSQVVSSTDEPAAVGFVKPPR